jgi:hypothetical protein
MPTRFILAALLALAGPFGGSPWDKPPEKWNEADVSRILQDSPWSPATVKLHPEISSHQTDPQTRLQTDAPPNSDNANQIPGIQLSRSRPQPKIPVIWWSSKTVRLAQLRLLQLRDPHMTAAPLSAEELPDYVLVIEGTEPLRILQDATEDLHDTVFLELSNGTTLDLQSVLFSNGSATEAPHVEFHFPRELEGRPTLDPDSERVVFHCKATAKTPRPAHDNSLSIRAEFKPRAMRVHGAPDL